MEIIVGLFIIRPFLVVLMGTVIGVTIWALTMSVNALVVASLVGGVFLVAVVLLSGAKIETPLWFFPGFIIGLLGIYLFMDMDPDIAVETGVRLFTIGGSIIGFLLFPLIVKMIPEVTEQPEEEIFLNQLGCWGNAILGAIIGGLLGALGGYLMGITYELVSNSELLFEINGWFERWVVNSWKSILIMAAGMFIAMFPIFIWRWKHTIAILIMGVLLGLLAMFIITQTGRNDALIYAIIWTGVGLLLILPGFLLDRAISAIQ